MSRCELTPCHHCGGAMTPIASQCDSCGEKRFRMSLIESADARCRELEARRVEQDGLVMDAYARLQATRRDLDAVHAVGWAAVVQREEWRTAYCESELRADRVRARAAKAEQERDEAVTHVATSALEIGVLCGKLATRDDEVARLTRALVAADDWIANAKAALGGRT